MPFTAWLKSSSASGLREKQKLLECKVSPTKRAFRKTDHPKNRISRGSLPIRLSSYLSRPREKKISPNCPDSSSIPSDSPVGAQAALLQKSSVISHGPTTHLPETPKTIKTCLLVPKINVFQNENHCFSGSLVPLVICFFRQGLIVTVTEPT